MQPCRCKRLASVLQAASSAHIYMCNPQKLQSSVAETRSSLVPRVCLLKDSQTEPRREFCSLTRHGAVAAEARGAVPPSDL